MTSRRSRIFSITLLLPAIIGVGGLIGYPLYLVLSLSFRNGATINFQRLAQHAIGVANYVSVLMDPSIWHSALVTVIYSLGTITPAFCIGILSALLLNSAVPLRRAFRTLLLLPWAVPGIVGSLAFLWLLNPSYGVVNSVLRHLYLISSNLPWYSSPRTALVSVILPTIWKAYPLNTLMVLAALQTIPKELYESAAVEGANAIQNFRFITWPAIRSSATLALLLSMEFTVGAFDIVYVMTQGGPSNATSVVAVKIYNEGFSFFHMGFAAALGSVVLVVLALIILLFFRRALLRSFF